MTVTARTFRQLTHVILDLDYGDEQERLRYFETYAIVVHLQLIALPVIAAAVIGICGQNAMGPALIMLGAALTAMLIGATHLDRHNVRTESIAISERNRGYLVVYALSLLTVVLACIARGSGTTRGIGIGAAVGIIIGLAAIVFAVRHRRVSREPNDPEA